MFLLICGEAPIGPCQPLIHPWQTMMTRFTAVLVGWTCGDNANHGSGPANCLMRDSLAVGINSGEEAVFEYLIFSGIGQGI